MRYFNGKWHYRGCEYATLHDALMSVWPQKENDRPCGNRNGHAKKELHNEIVN